MFEGIQKTLGEALKKLRGRAKLTEANIRDGLREVRRAFLEADVNLDVLNQFIQTVERQAVGQAVLQSANPSEQIIKIVYDELVKLMGPVEPGFKFAKDRPTILMLCGLQGAGKTTTAGKLATTLKSQGRVPLLVAADLQRPAAVEQLKVIGEQIGVPVYTEASDPVSVCRNAISHAKKHGCDTVILDTAGRLHVAEMPMDELRTIDRQVKPDYVLFVCDGMTGQDAVNSAKAFNDALELNGVILTKMDGDTRGGAALSIKQVTKVPIKYIGVGEKLDKLEAFRPESMAQRIMGQGDLMGLVEKIAALQASIGEAEIRKQQQKLAEGDFTLNDFRQQFGNIAKLGGMKDMLGHIPGLQNVIPEGEDPEAALRRVQGMIDSMTKQERQNPDLIDLSRRRRIAAGCGSEPHEVKQFLTQFEQVRGLVRQMKSMSIWQRLGMIRNMGQSGMFNPGSPGINTKGDTGHRKSAKERAEDRKRRAKQEKKRKK